MSTGYSKVVVRTLGRTTLLSMLGVVTWMSGSLLCAQTISLAPCRNIDRSLKSGLTGSVDVSGGLTRATADKNSVSASLTLNDFRHPQACGPQHQQTSLTIGGGYDDKHPKGKPLSVTRNYEATAQHLVYLPGNQFYVAGNARLVHSTDLGLYLGQRYSAVLGTQFGPQATRWELFAGPAYVGQHFLKNASTGLRQSSRSYAAAYVGELGSIRLAKLDSAREVRLTHAYWATIPATREDPYALNTKWLAAIHLPLTTRVGIKGQVFDEYLRNAPIGFEHDFLNASMGVSVTLGKQ
ncbi:MAG TPA: hypothetical protein VNC11_15530 [Gemmatimonadaceae bacterium]|jgi:hypothetical protein|nr:hypothetical protein [Gemmatimonadaceae bacterium]